MPCQLGKYRRRSRRWVKLACAVSRLQATGTHDWWDWLDIGPWWFCGDWGVPDVGGHSERGRRSSLSVTLIVVNFYMAKLSRHHAPRIPRVERGSVILNRGRVGAQHCSRVINNNPTGALEMATAEDCALQPLRLLSLVVELGAKPLDG